MLNWLVPGPSIEQKWPPLLPFMLGQEQESPMIVSPNLCMVEVTNLLLDQDARVDIGVSSADPGSHFCPGFFFSFRNVCRMVFPALLYLNTFSLINTVYEKIY